MKTKPIVMIVTFIVMILLTPIIFSKLMNAKYDTMLLELSQNGYKIKTLKEKIGYLKSERVLDVVVPGSKLGLNEVEYIEAEVKTYFKNLPVTNVYFDGFVKDIKLKHQNKIIEDIAKRIKFKAITPDFKTYAFSVEPIKYNGLFIDETKGKLNVKKGVLTFDTNFKARENNLTLYVSDFNSLIEKKEGFFKSDSSFNINLGIKDKNASIKDVTVSNVLSLKDALINLKLAFNKLFFSKIIEADKFFTDVKLYDFNKTLFKEAFKSKDKNLTSKLLASGFKADINASLKNLIFLGFNQGWFKLNIKAIFYKADNVQDFENHINKYLAISIKADMSKEFAKMLRNVPVVGAFVRAPADKNGIVHIRINLPRGSIK